MRFSDKSCPSLGRVLLVLGLICSIPVSGSAQGEALVLHSHGSSRVHLHLLGFWDVLSNAASSSTFGHSSLHDRFRELESGDVRILAIISTGSVCLLTPDDSGILKVGLSLLQTFPLGSAAELQVPRIVGDTTAFDFTTLGRRATAVLLQRNHTLLI